MRRIRRDPETPPGPRLQPVDPHESCDRLATGSIPALPQLGVHSRTPVPRPTLGVNRPNLQPVGRGAWDEREFRISSPALEVLDHPLPAALFIVRQGRLSRAADDAARPSAPHRWSRSGPSAAAPPGGASLQRPAPAGREVGSDGGAASPRPGITSRGTALVLVLRPARPSARRTRPP